MDLFLLLFLFKENIFGEIDLQTKDKIKPEIILKNGASPKSTDIKMDNNRLPFGRKCYFETEEKNFFLLLFFVGIMKKNNVEAIERPFFYSQATLSVRQ